MMSSSRRYALYALAACVLSMVLGACASMGRPEGGPRDEVPPMFVRSNPMPGAINVTGNKITIDFDENIQLDDPMNKIVVSPAQHNNPAISSNGRRVTIELRDTLLPNTTYVIDFADAIKDLNEGNVLDGFAIDFSTGADIDSLRISGMVLQAQNLEPAQGMLVGAYLERPDSAIRTLPFDRITKTNQYGQFTLRGLKPGSYTLYALTDNNHDFHWDRSEDIAFYDIPITPTCEPTTVRDTIRNPLTGMIDSIVSREATLFLPNDVLLAWFNENYLAQYLKEYSRKDRRKLDFVLGAPTDTLPSMRIVSGPYMGTDIAQVAVLQANERGDSITWWLTPEDLVMQDSLLIEATYQRVDSTDMLVWTTDTLRMHFRAPKGKKEKENEAQADSVPQVEYMNLSVLPGAGVDIPALLTLHSTTPISTIDPQGLRLEMLVDTVWTEQALPEFRYLSNRNTLDAIAEVKWVPGARYKLTVDSAAVTDIYGHPSKESVTEMTVKGEADYSALYFNVSGTNRPMVVELLDGQDNPVRREKVTAGSASFQYLNPGTYYARLFIDDNDNGIWDTGLLADSIQPEEVYYYPKPLNLKKNWDVEQSWSIYDLPLDLQKPVKIKKNKPKLRPGETLPDNNAGTDDEMEEGIPNPNYNPFDPNSKRYLDPYTN